jgi:hypothetical protein
VKWRLRTGFTSSFSVEWRLRTGFLPSGVEISSRAPHSRQLDCSDSRPSSLLHGLGSVWRLQLTTWRNIAAKSELQSSLTWQVAFHHCTQLILKRNKMNIGNIGN